MTHVSGGPLAVVRLLAVYALVGLMLYGARPKIAFVAGGALLIALGEAIRCWSAGHLLKNDRLITAGPYRYVRNPLYLGRLLIFTGLCVATGLPYGLNWWILPAGWLVFFGYYLPRKERVEPARLRELHGAKFDAYRKSVPSLLPRFTPYPGAEPQAWSLGQALANREHWMLIALTAIVAFLGWRALG
jgi:protein-S-isoprenylcysteine O-methyltransferase Ste14